MDRRQFGGLLLGAMGIPALHPRPLIAQPNRRWSFTAAVAECCSCEIPCPCNFGRPTRDGCFGNRLIQFTSGDFEEESLAGAAFLVTFSMGQWTRIHIDESLSPGQAAALDALLPVAFRGFHTVARTIQRVPLSVQRTADTVRFSVPESTVEMKLMPGLNGEPIRVSNLPNTAYYDYIQYESVVHSHRSGDGDWSYSGTNGFTSEMRVSG